MVAGIDPASASGVTLQRTDVPSPMTLRPPYIVTLPLLSSLRGQGAAILFRLISGGDNTTDTVTISSLVVGPQFNAAPEQKEGEKIIPR